MKKTLLSIALVGFAFVASSQTTIFKDNFNSYTIGNISTGFDPMTEGQGGWITETLYAGNNAATEIVSVGINDNALQISGYNGPSTTSPTPSANRTVFRFLTSEWASRPSGQNTIVVKFQMKIPALSSSKNSFSSFLTDANGNRLVGVNFNPSTRKLIAIGSVVIPAQGANPEENYYGAPFNLYWNDQAGAYEPLILPDVESIVDVIFKFNKDNGQFWVEVIGDAMVNGVSTPGVDSYYYSNPNADNNALKAVDPVEIMFSASAGTGNSSSESISFDELFITSESCLTSNDSQFKYSSKHVCVGSTNLTPTIDNPNATGVFTVTPNTGLSINSTTGAIDVSTATPGTYTIKYVTDAVTNYGICSDFHTEQIIIQALVPTFSSISICSGETVTLPLTSTNFVAGTWTPTPAPITIATEYTFQPSANQCATSPFNLTVAVNPNITPTFSTPVAICSGLTATLPSTSTNSVAGTWSPTPAAITANQVYTFTATTVGCYTTAQVTVPVTANVTPTFTIKDLVCKGSAAFTLPVSSSNSTPITGTWSAGSPSATVTTVATSTVGAAVYTFTPSPSICATNYTKTVTVSTCAGIEEAIISPFTIYPNPTNDVISVSFSELTSINGTIRFISADGKLIESREYTNSSVETFDVKSLNPGIYFLQIDNSIEKVIVQ